MTDREYIEKQIAIIKEFDRATKSKPYDPEFYNSIVDKANLLQQQWQRGRRRRSRFMILFIVFLLYCLAWIVWAIFF